MLTLFAADQPAALRLLDEIVPELAGEYSTVLVISAAGKDAEEVLRRRFLNYHGGQARSGHCTLRALSVALGLLEHADARIIIKSRLTPAQLARFT